MYARKEKPQGFSFVRREFLSRHFMARFLSQFPLKSYTECLAQGYFKVFN
jgi:hypothetical protein